MSTAPQKNSVPEVSGYRLIDKIGSGGYGEVWSAEAPGGLRKAIKFIYGDQVGQRASNELHSLEKIKEVRHPFLLSLERIEVVEDRLVIVTELADGSLRDRRRECLQEGLPGIPREELLRYLSEAADVLDYLGANHGLAHLDVKPENLLFVAGHVKVADFGLVKSVGNRTQASLVAGMTPAYAAPEVFQGAPSLKSDQYSLAILFQEMLTGSLPYAGETCAELTLQHLNHEPDLSALKESDRYVLSRALAKSPDHRYDTAAEMVRELIAGFAPGEEATQETPTPAVAAKAASSKPIPQAEQAGRATVMFGDVENETQHDPSAFRIDLPPVVPATTEDIPDGAHAPEGAFAPTPAVFLGVGGTGAAVLRALRAKLQQRCGSDGPTPSLPLLLLDTDRTALSELNFACDELPAIRAQETIELPLKRPQEYRQKSASLLNWLGRRWLYNIPKSLATEGIRPLGRLALADHARRVCQRVRMVISEALAPQSRGLTEQTLGVKLNDQGLRVYVVASASGGAGGGVSHDLAYAVRTILKRIGLDDAKLIGVITHSSPRDVRRAELAKINAYAWLTELHHFQASPGGYPGDPGCGLPEHAPGVAPYDEVYFTSLGDGLDDGAFAEAAGSVADYLLGDALTPLQRPLDAIRAADRQENTRPVGLRSFAVRSASQGAGAEASRLAELLVRCCIDGWRLRPTRRWRGSSDTAGEALIESAARKEAELVGLSPKRLVEQCHETLVIQPSLVERFAAEVNGQKALEHLCRTAFPNGSVETASAEQSALLSALKEQMKPCVHALVTPCLESIESVITGNEAGFSIAASAAVQARQRLEAMNAELSARLSNLAEESAEPDSTDSTWTRQHTMESACLICARMAISAIERRFREFLDQLEAVDTLLAKTELELPCPEENSEESTGPGAPQELVNTLRSEAQAELFEGMTPAAFLLNNAAPPSAQRLCVSLELLAKRLVRRTLARHWMQRLNETGESPFPGCAHSGSGGVLRRLAVVPSNGAAEGSNRRLPEATVVTDSQDTLMLVTEQSGLSLRHLAASIVNHRRDYVELAARVLTRRDIDWLDPLGPPAPTAGATPFEAGATPAHTEVLH